MTTVYLAPAPTGDDTRTYAQAQNPATPWATPGKVDASAVSGDTVSLAAGTYTFANITFTKSFIWNGAALSNGLPTTIISAGGASNQWQLVGTNTFSNIRFSNFAPSANIYMFFPNTAGANTFTNCEFRNINIGDRSYLLRGGAINTCTFNSCIFNDIYNSNGAVGSYCFYLDSAALNVVVNNCTIYCKSSTGLIYLSFSTLTTLKNCIVYNGSGQALSFAAYAYAATYTDFYLCDSSPAGTGNITSDPLFIDAVNANFNLRPTSPCLGTGTIV